MKKLGVTFFSLIFFLTSSAPVWAHVVVRPNEVSVGTFQTFTIGVPVEKEIPTTQLRLIIPDGLNHVTPNVKSGWTIDVVKEGEGENAKVKEIRWTGGSIPTGQRDEFLFSAQVPSKESSVIWKAYQTYEDGTIVSWDQDPKREHGHAGENASGGPFSETKVINDLAGKKGSHHESRNERRSQSVPMTLSVMALALSAAALTLQLRRKK